MVSGIDSHGRLIQGLMRPDTWPEGLEIRCIETHISSVLLVGDYAYKIKKPVNLGFLNFSSLERRKWFCEEELRLNGRLAPHIYLQVVPITGSMESPVMEGPGIAIEYAVKMRRFAEDALLSRHPQTLSAELIDRIAERVAGFHGEIARADEEQGFGTPGAVLAPMLQNFSQVRGLLRDETELQRLAALELWTRQAHGKLHQALMRRLKQGFVRECHGDMHLGNIALDGGELLIFDGIEFNPNLRWIDTMNELAFLFMDLDEKGRADLAWRLVNVYLRYTGDFEGIALLRFYLTYRAMVRAKVAAIRMSQSGLEESERQQGLVEYRAYVAQAERYTCPPRSALIITCGVSGSGKSTLTEPLVGKLGALRVRSDVERKRMSGLDPWASTDSQLGKGIYASNMTEKTYGRLRYLAEILLAAGHVAIVDATFLKIAQRQPFQALAAKMGVPFVILSFQADESVLRERVGQRLLMGHDPSEADLEVLGSQLKNREMLNNQEVGAAIVVNEEQPLDLDELESRLNPCL